MIRVECLSKTFKKEIKKNGLKGSISSFFNPKIEEVYAVNNISFHVDKGEILGFRTKWGRKVNYYKNDDGYTESFIWNM